MLAGTIVSAIFGGMVGLTCAALQDCGVLQSILFYQIGGIVAFLTFVAISVPVSTVQGRGPEH